MLKKTLTESLKKYKTEILNFLLNQVGILLTYIYFELLLRISCQGGFSQRELWMLALSPAVSMFFTLMIGWSGKMVNSIVTKVVVFILTIYYFSQFIYSKIFESYWSFSMIGMGKNAVVDFGTAILQCMKNNWYWIFLLCLPFGLAFVLARFTKFKTVSVTWVWRLIFALLVVPVWMLGVFVVKLGGIQRGTPYYVYSGTMSDTDTTAGVFGALQTTFIEMGMGRLNFGSYSEEDALLAVIGNDQKFLYDSDILLIDPVFPSMEISKADTAETDPHEGKSSDADHEAPTSTPSSSTNTEENLTQNTTPMPISTPTSTPTPTPVTYWIDESIDFAELAKKTTNSKMKTLCEYYNTVTPTYKNDFTGMFEGYNLVYVCAESFWTYAANKDFTPTLYKMMNNGIVLTNYYNSFNNVTTNGEYAFMTGMWPNVSRKWTDGGSLNGTFAKSYDKYMPFGLGNMLAKLGITSYAYHGNRGSYYGRNQSWPNLGYICDFKYDENDGGTLSLCKSKSNWITSDLELVEETIGNYIDDDIFHTYYMSFSGHGPYDKTSGRCNVIMRNNLPEAERINKECGYNYGKDVLGYMSANMELDKAMAYLLEVLEEKGKLENTVIVIAGDHYPYYLGTDELRDEAAGYHMENDMERFKSNCIIYCAGIKEPIYCDTYCSNVDILPTIFNLFNLEFDSRLLAGKDVFATNVTHKAVLYNKSFLTDKVVYDASMDATEWKIDTALYSKDTLDKYFTSVSSMVDAEYAASVNTVEYDFYRFVYDNIK